MKIPDWLKQLLPIYIIMTIIVIIITILVLSKS